MPLACACASGWHCRCAAGRPRRSRRLCARSSCARARSSACGTCPGGCSGAGTRRSCRRRSLAAPRARSGPRRRSGAAPARRPRSGRQAARAREHSPQCSWLFGGTRQSTCGEQRRARRALARAKLAKFGRTVTARNGRAPEGCQPKHEAQGFRDHTV
eukprot:scaffold93462_cov60-Phaeocystis_antarctica.AAC.3